MTERSGVEIPKGEGMSKEEEALYDKETDDLMRMESIAREKYCRETVLAVAEALKVIGTTKGKINQYKKAKQVFKELGEQRHKLMPAMMFTIKKPYREAYLKLLDGLVGASV